MKRSFLTLIGALGVWAALESPALASQGFQEIIPASACQIEDEEDIGKADLVDGSWLMGASTAKVTASLTEVLGGAGLPTLLDSISSNSVATTTDTRHDKILAVFTDELQDAQHYVRVVMKQGSNNGTDRVRFTRVRLFVNPPEFN